LTINAVTCINLDTVKILPEPTTFFSQRFIWLKCAHYFHAFDRHAIIRTIPLRDAYSGTNYSNQMQTIELIQIGASGCPLTDVGRLDDIARQVCAATAGLYRVTGFGPPWVGYLASVDKHLVGACAFKAPPVDGNIEIGYFTFPDAEGQGVATLMVRQLLEIVRAENPALTVHAQTENEENASNAVLKKFGFNHVGTASDPEDGEIWLWQLADVNKSPGLAMGNRHV